MSRLFGINVLLVVAALLAVAGWAMGAAGPAAPPPPSVRGTPGQAEQAAVMNFMEIARSEAGKPVSAEQFVAPYMPEPADLIGLAPTAAPALPRLFEPAAPQAGFQLNSPSPAASFLALEDNNASIPPDTHGSAGPNALMVTLNTQVRIMNRTGGVTSTVALNSFWSLVNGGSGAFDPKVLYDPYGGRWIVVACDDSRSASSGVLIGASQTSDPTGLWNLFKVDGDAANLLWVDYPSIGFNKDWIVVHVNMFTISGDNYSTGHTYVFNKAAMYNNAAPSAPFTLFTDPDGTTNPALTHDAALSTVYLLQTFSSAAGQLRLYSITGAVGSESLNGPTTITSPEAWVSQPAGGADFAPQSGSAQLIQVNDARMQNLVYRNGSLWAAQTIFLPAGGTPTRSSVQWWQLTTGGVIMQRGRIDDATGTTFYAFPSIAVNKDDGVLIGYSRFSASQFASGNYSFRAAGDPADTLRADTVLKAGEAPYFKTFSGTRNRWGDYSHTVVDPVNDTDFWTIQEYAATPSGGFDRWGTWWGRIVPPAVATATPSTTPTSTATPTGTPTPTRTPTPTSTPSIPDLIVESIDTAPTFIATSQPITVSAVIRNLGAAMSTPVRVELYADDSPAGCSDPGFFNWSGVALAGGAAVTLTTTHPGFGTDGQHSFVVYADSFCQQAEFNEANNTLTKTVQVGQSRLYLPMIMNSPPGVVLNGDFEQGATTWTQFSAQGWPLIINTGFPQGIAPRSGTWAVWLGGDDMETAAITQTVYVSPINPYLAYYHWADSAENFCSFDYAFVNINGLAVDTFALCGATNTSGWAKRVINLSSYAGQTVALSFKITTDQTVNSNWFVDDVAFQTTSTLAGGAGQTQTAAPDVATPRRR